jgi:hypothetical protein
LTRSRLCCYLFQRTKYFALDLSWNRTRHARCCSRCNFRALPKPAQIDSFVRDRTRLFPSSCSLKSQSSVSCGQAADGRGGEKEVALNWRPLPAWGCRTFVFSFFLLTARCTGTLQTRARPFGEFSIHIKSTSINYCATIR